MAITRKLLSYSSNLLMYRVYPKNSNPAASFHCHEINPLLLLVNPQLMKKPKSDLGRLQKLLAKIRKDIGPITDSLKQGRNEKEIYENLLMHFKKQGLVINGDGPVSKPRRKKNKAKNVSEKERILPPILTDFTDGEFDWASNPTKLMDLSDQFHDHIYGPQSKSCRIPGDHLSKPGSASVTQYTWGEEDKD